jgi:hypothetical protein
MTFQPVLPATGYVGWRFLQATLPRQEATHSASVPVKRATDYFRDNIAKVRTADDLVADRRLLQVALGAFGLDDDINNRAFIRKVLAEGTLKDDAFANRLGDKRYAALAREFGFGDLGPRTNLASFATRMIDRFESRSFQRAVGNQDDNLRLALNLQDGLAEVTAETANPRAQWFAVMGNPPLRRVFETALGFPSSFGAVDLDRQLRAFQTRAQSTFGTDKIADLARDPRQMDKLVRLFLIRADSQGAQGLSGASAALTLLQR